MPFKRFITEKLIRDHLPSILRAKGIVLNERILDQDEFIIRLKDKLLEEAQEANVSQNFEDLSEELADMLETIQSIAKATGLSMHQIEQKRLEKLKIKGGFDCKIYCNCIDIEENNPAIAYYLEKSQQYPKINGSEITAQEITAKPNGNEKIKEGFVSIKDGKLFYRTIGKGLPLIVLHGGPGLDQDYLLPQLYKLADNNLVIFYDQRGSGRSLETKLDDKHINIDQFVEDLETLRTSLGIDKFILLGHSWGGLLAMQYAVDHQENLIGLILLNTAPADYKGQKAFIDEFGLRTKSIHNNIKPLFAYEDFKKLNVAQISDLYRKLFSVYFYNPMKVKGLSLNFSVVAAQSGFKVMEEMSKTYWLQPNVDLFPSLKRLAVSTFILHGKQDIVPSWTAQEIKDTIPLSEIVVLDHCNHFPYIEQPFQFFAELNNFLYKINHSQVIQK